MNASAHHLYLLCLQGKERGHRFALAPGGHYVIGRDPGEDGIPISDLLASRRHAVLAVDDSTIDIEDQKSANGTRVNGKPIDSPTTLHNGDIVTVGHSSFVLEDPRVQSSSDHLSDSTRTHRRRQSQRLKRQLQQQRTVHVGPAEAAATEETGASLLTDLLTALPLALLVFDQSGRILLANDGLRSLIDDEGTLPGQEVTPVIAALADNLLFPEDLETAITSDDRRPMRMELPEGRAWLVWSHHRDDQCTLFILASDHLHGQRL